MPENTQSPKPPTLEELRAAILELADAIRCTVDGALLRGEPAPTDDVERHLQAAYSLMGVPF